MKISLKPGVLSISAMLMLLVLKLAVWVGLFYVAQHFVVKYW